MNADQVRSLSGQLGTNLIEFTNKTLTGIVLILSPVSI